MCRIDLCGQIGVKISIYGDRIFLKFNPLNCPMGQFIRREDRRIWKNAGRMRESVRHRRRVFN